MKIIINIVKRFELISHDLTTKYDGTGHRAVCCVYSVQMYSRQLPDWPGLQWSVISRELRDNILVTGAMLTLPSPGLPHTEPTHSNKLR